MIRLIRLDHQWRGHLQCIWMGWDWVGWMGCLSKAVDSTFADKFYHFFQNFCINVGSLQSDVIAIITERVYNALFSSQLDWVEHRPFSKFLDISGEHQLRGKIIHQI